MNTITYLVGDTRAVVAAGLPDGSIDLVVTSPPFLALRSYLPPDHPDKAHEIGSEPTPAAFLDTLLTLTADWRRVLAPHGSIAVELGDTYSGSGGGGGDYLEGGLREGQPGFGGSAELAREGNAAHWRQKNADPAGWPLAKSLTLIPGLYAASLAYGRNLLNPAHEIEPWRVRNVIAWVRPNPPVGALGDKVRPATSYVTTACVSDKRWFDLDAERVVQERRSSRDGSSVKQAPTGMTATFDYGKPTNHTGAPLLDWWEITPGGYPGAHYAVYPVELPRRLVSLACPFEVCQDCGDPRRRLTARAQQGTGRTTNGHKPRDRAESFADTTYERRTEAHVTTVGFTDCGHASSRPGIVLDPFAGTGTTGVAAALMGRDALLIDLDARNLDLARDRIAANVEIVTETSVVGGVCWGVRTRPAHREQVAGQLTMEIA